VTSSEFLGARELAHAEVAARCTQHTHRRARADAPDRLAIETLVAKQSAADSQ